MRAGLYISKLSDINEIRRRKWDALFVTSRTKYAKKVGVGHPLQNLSDKSANSPRTLDARTKEKDKRHRVKRRRLTLPLLAG